MNQELLSAIFGAVVSFIFGSVPGAKDWYDKQTTEIKRLVMGGALLIVSAAVYGLACAGALEHLIPGSGVQCTQEGIWSFVRIFIFSFLSNQSMYTMVYKPSSTKQ